MASMANKVQALLLQLSLAPAKGVDEEGSVKTLSVSPLAGMGVVRT